MRPHTNFNTLTMWHIVSVLKFVKSRTQDLNTNLTFIMYMSTQ